MRIETLREFTCLVRSMSYRAAAKELYIAPSTLSAHISALEAEAGFALLERDPRGRTTLTEAGATFYSGVQRILEELDSSLERSREIARRAAPLRVMAWRRMEPALYAHYEETGMPFTPTEYDAAKDSLYQTLADGRVDVLFSVNPAVSEELTAQATRFGLSHLEIQGIEHQVVVQKSNALASLDALSRADLEGRTVLIHSVFDAKAIEQAHVTLLGGVPNLKFKHEPATGTFRNVLFRDLDDCIMLQPPDTVAELQSVRSDLAFFDTLDGQPMIMPMALLWKRDGASSAAEPFARSFHAFLQRKAAR